MIKYPAHSIINVAGLTCGIAFTLIITAFIWSELHVNADLKNIGRQYILESKWKDKNMGYELATFGQLAKSLKETYPHLVANYYRWDGITSNVSKENKVFREGIQIGDSTLLNMYGFTLKYGDAAKALNGPYKAVISADRAIKYFGKTDVIGETITIESLIGSRHDFIVSGVLDMPERNSVTNLIAHYGNEIFVSTENLDFFGRNMDWANFFIVNYIELQPGVMPAELDKPVQHLIAANAPKGIDKELSVILKPLKQYYVNADNAVVRKTLFALSAIAFFILLMAIVNFVNLTISRSSGRMREIGIRKVLGGLRKQLTLQFLVESLCFVTIATLAAVLLYALTKNIFSDLLGKPMPSLAAFPTWFIFLPVMLIVVISVLAGIYPALVLSSLKTVDSLKGKLTGVKENQLLKKILVGFQFGTAAFVFICAGIITQQMHLFFTKDPGYNKDYVLSVLTPRDWSQAGVSKMETIRRSFADMPQVSSVSLGYEVPDGNNGGQVVLYRPGADSTMAVASQQFTCDEFYRSIFDIPMAAGEFFGKEGEPADPTKIVINETQAKALGWANPNDAIGREIVFKGFNGYKAVIAGVVKDFNVDSFQKAIPPVTFVHVKASTIYRMFCFKLKPGNMASSIEEIRKKWSALLPGTAFDYTFIDDNLRKLYDTEIQLKKASYAATILALIIVLLGILGLVSLSIEKRVKEIGIRKILGSSVRDIVFLFVKEFVLIILVSVIIICPLAYMLMNEWLNEYAYRITITPLPFIIAIGSITLLTFVIVLMRTMKAAMANPVKSLRTE